MIKIHFIRNPQPDEDGRHCHADRQSGNIYRKEAKALLLRRFLRAILKYFLNILIS